jgi:elongation factor Ts
MVRELREKSGAAMMDCKKALEASGGDMDAAFDHLRKAGLKTAAKKAGRETSEGRVHALLAEDGRTGGMISVACETDFVANTPDFSAMLEEYASVARDNELPEADGDRLEHFGTLKTSGGEPVAEHLKQVIGKLGENIQLAGATHMSNPGGYVGTYIHHNSKVGVLASVTTSADREKAEDVLRKLAQHVAAFRPPYLNREDVPAEDVERERQVHRESDELSKKPEEIREKIIDGKLNKFYSEQCLNEQGWIMDDKTPVAKAIAAELGGEAKIEAFELFVIG